MALVSERGSEILNSDVVGMKFESNIMKQKTFLHKSSQPYPEPSIQKWGKENKKENLSKCCKRIYHSPMMSDAEYI